MELKKIFEMLLENPMANVSPMVGLPVLVGPAPAATPGMASVPVQPTTPPVQDASFAELPGERDPVIEIPEVNMNVSFFPAQKEVMLSPQDHTATTDRIEQYIDLIQQYFRVSDLKNKEGNIQISFDPREDFESVIQFLNQLGTKA